jgi:hypothetical protein
MLILDPFEIEVSFPAVTTIQKPEEHVGLKTETLNLN